MTRSVIVSYAHTREQWCEVVLAGFGEPEQSGDLFDFVRGVSNSEAAYTSASDAVALKREAARCCELLVQYCAQFLAGDILGFRKSYRETFLVNTVRAAQYNANAQKNWVDFGRYHNWLRDYWTDDDLRISESARRRGWR